MDYDKTQYARNLASRFWFNNNDIKMETIAQYWDITVDEVCDILRSEEYKSAVYTLIRTTRSRRNIRKWMETSIHAQPSMLAERMKLPEEEISEILEKLKQYLYNR